MKQLKNQISVIIPNYNRQELIGETIENMLMQTLPPREVIIVDDGSTDGSLSVIRSFSRHVKILEQKNQGPGAARNAGFAISTGKFIQFFDSDDLASRNKLKTQAEALEETCADFAYCPWVRVKIKNKKIGFIGPVMQGQALPEKRSMLEWQLGPWCIIFQNCLFRREILLKAGRFRTDLMPSEDSEYLIRILLAGAKPIFTEECIVFYREHDYDRITDTGLTARQRTEDWKKYYEIVGEQIKDRLSRFEQATKTEIAQCIYKHNSFCIKNGWHELKVKEPFHKIIDETSFLKILIKNICEKIKRKAQGINNSTPISDGLKVRAKQRTDLEMAEQLGLTVID